MSTEEYRGYIISREPNFSQFVIKYDGKGSIADQLGGYYQQKHLAKLAVDRYLDEPKKVEKKNSLIEDIRAGKA